MSDYFELLINDPDFIFDDAESAYFHFNMALTNTPRSPLESAVEAESVAKKQNISKAAAAMLVSQEIQDATSHETGEWRLGAVVGASGFFVT